MKSVQTYHNTVNTVRAVNAIIDWSAGGKTGCGGHGRWGVDLLAAASQMTDYYAFLKAERFLPTTIEGNPALGMWRNS